MPRGDGAISLHQTKKNKPRRLERNSVLPALLTCVPSVFPAVEDLVAPSFGPCGNRGLRSLNLTNVPYYMPPGAETAAGNGSPPLSTLHMQHLGYVGLSPLLSVALKVTLNTGTRAQATGHRQGAPFLRHAPLACCSVPLAAGFPKEMDRTPHCGKVGHMTTSVYLLSTRHPPQIIEDNSSPINSIPYEETRLILPLDQDTRSVKKGKLIRLSA